MNNKQFFYIVFFIFTLFLLFLGCTKKQIDTIAPSIEDQDFLISDNSRVGYQVGQIEASDDNGVVKFFIENSNIVTAFAIDNEGNLTVADTSSFKTFPMMNFYNLIIKASDQAGNSSTGQFMITVTNAPPVIEDQDFLISDTSVNGDSVGIVIAYDVRGIESYTITDGNTSTAFALDNEGKLTVANSSDFAATVEYTLTIEILDEINKTATAMITITLGDVPPIIPSEQEFQIREHSLANSVVDKLGTDDDKLVATDDKGISGYEIVDGNISNAFIINNNGEIKLTGDVDIDFETTDPAEYVLTIEVSDTGRNKTREDITINIINVILINVDNVTDDIILSLGGASGVTTTVINGTTYLFVSGRDDDGVSIFSVDNDGMLTSVTNVMNNGSLELLGASGLTTTVINGTTYLFVSGRDDDGVSVFSVGNNGMLTSVDNVTDSSSTLLELNGASDLTTTVINGTTYLFVSGRDDDGVSVFSVDNNGMLTSVDNVMDNNILELNGASGLTTTVINGTTYLFVSGRDDNGVSVFSVGNNGMLTSVDNVTDNGSLELLGASGLTTTVINGTTYLFIAGRNDNGVNVFSVDNDGMLTSVDNVMDNNILELNGASGLTTTLINGTTYLFVASFSDNGVSVFSVGNNGMLTSVDNVMDNSILELNGASGVTTTVINGTTYLFVAGRNDNGVSVFRIEQ